MVRWRWGRLSRLSTSLHDGEVVDSVMRISIFLVFVTVEDLHHLHVNWLYKMMPLAQRLG